MPRERYIARTNRPAAMPDSAASSRIPAWTVRVLWIFPVAIGLLGLNQALVAWDIRETLETGTPATAEVIGFESRTGFATHDYVIFRMTSPEAASHLDSLTLPNSLATRLEGQATLDMVIRPGESQGIVVTQIAATQWRIAAVNALMCFAGALMALFGVIAWQRYLRREGDPAQRTHPTVSRSA